MKGNKTYIQRKKGQCIYSSLVENIKSESGECNISWKYGHIYLNGEIVEFVRSTRGILALVKAQDGENKQKTIQHYVSF